MTSVGIGTMIREMGLGGPAVVAKPSAVLAKGLGARALRDVFAAAENA